MTKEIAVAASMILLLAQSTNIAQAKTWKGIWDGNSHWTSTLEFLSGKRVKYCFQAQCVIKPYFGSEKATIRFNWGAALFSFEWNGQGYNGVRRVGATTNRGLLE